MTITKAQLRTRVLKWADAESSGRWDVTPGGEVDLKIGSVHDREWKRILNVNRYVRFAQRTPTVDSQGRILMTDLTANSGTDSAERLYRIMALALDNAPYQEVQFVQFPLAVTTNANNWRRVYWREGDYLRVLPAMTYSAPAQVWVNHLPQRHDLLTGEGSTVVFPDGYEEILALEGAALLLSKGGAETGAASELQSIAEGMREDMLADLSRTSTNPTVMTYTDFAQEWGGM